MRKKNDKEVYQHMEITSLRFFAARVWEDTHQGGPFGAKLGSVYCLVRVHNAGITTSGRNVNYRKDNGKGVRGKVARAAPAVSDTRVGGVTSSKDGSAKKKKEDEEEDLEDIPEEDDEEDEEEVLSTEEDEEDKDRKEEEDDDDKQEGPSTRRKLKRACGRKTAYPNDDDPDTDQEEGV